MSMETFLIEQIEKVWGDILKYDPESNEQYLMSLFFIGKLAGILSVFVTISHGLHYVLYRLPEKNDVYVLCDSSGQPLSINKQELALTPFVGERRFISAFDLKERAFDPYPKDISVDGGRARRVEPDFRFLWGYASK